jgi:hypothetical protein
MLAVLNWEDGSGFLFTGESALSRKAYDPISRVWTWRYSMQLHLETDELNLIANVLFEREARTRKAASSEGPPPSANTTQHLYQELLDKVLARDLEFDSEEMADLAAILEEQRSELRDSMAHCEPAAQAEAQRRLRTLEPVLERIEEVCVMF